MRYFKWLLLHALSAQAAIRARDHEKFDYFAIQLHDSSDPREIASSLHATLEGPLGELPHHYIVSCPKAQSSQLELSLQELRRRREIRRRNGEPCLGVVWHQKQKLKKRHPKRIPPVSGYSKRAPPANSGLTKQQEADKAHLDTIATTLKIEDPIFKAQWHIFNYLKRGVDTNVTGAWLQGVTGAGVVSAIMDDGLDFNSNDLKSNYFAEGSYDYCNPGPDPLPRLDDDRHGTRCAGEIAAVRNNVCGVGLAYDSKVAGIRMLSVPISDEDEAAAMNYKYQQNHIYSCSWGPPDDGKTMEAPDILIRRALVNGVQQGRDGKGSIYVFAAGNGAAQQDNCNFDGYTNSIYSITVGAIDHLGNQPYYSEKCSALITVAPSSGDGEYIHTNDVGVEACAPTHGGTSAAGPLMVGAAALALSVRPELTWRDVQQISIDSAVPFNLDMKDEWQNVAGGRKYSHTFGYGKMDAYGLVQAARTTKLLKPQAWYDSPWQYVNHAIPQGSTGLATSFDITDDMLKKVNFEKVEHVTVTMNVNHTRRGDLSVELKSPSGYVSHIATTRKNDVESAGFVDWTFMSVAHWGETGRGTWTVVIKDTVDNENNGTFVDWRLKLWGECINAAIQTPHPLPDEHDDDHDVVHANITTTRIDPTSHPATLTDNPTDHPDRPTKPKPTSSTSLSPPADITVTASTTRTVSTVTGTTTAIADATHTTSSSFLPGFFPTFGVSNKTLVWIYGSIGLIVVFCAGLGVYSFTQRRKRLRNSRDSYEFEMLHNQDMDESKRDPNSRKRGGELYNAFAADSDVFSDDELYQDTPDHDTGSAASGGSSGGKQGR